MGVVARLRSGNSHGLVFIALILLALILRGIGFGRSVIDWDETTYLLIARDLLQGKSLYVDMWDTKPPGIFLIFAGIEWLFTDGILGVRLVASLFVAATGWLIYRISLCLNRHADTALLAGTFYVATISWHSLSFAIGRGMGLEANTEMFFIFFTCLGVWMYLRSPKSFLQNYLAGAVLGVGFIIKYLVLFDMLALMVLILLTEKGRSLVVQGLTVGVGMLTPFLLVVAYYFLGPGNWEAFRDVTFGVVTDYANPIQLSNVLSFMGDLFYLSGIVTGCFALVLLQTLKNRNTDRTQLFLWVWFAFTVFSAIVPGRFFFHYLYQIIPPMVLLGAQIALPATGLSWKWTRGVVWFMVVVFPIVLLLKYQAFSSKPDTPREVASYINENRPGSTLFVDKAKHVVHYLTGSSPLTKYYHPSLLYKGSHIESMGIDQVGEYQNIFDQQPDYVLYTSKPSNPRLVPFLEGYEVAERFEGDVYLLKWVKGD